MDVREKLFILFQDCNNTSWKWFPNNAEMLKLIDYLITNGVTVQECGEWVHPKWYVLSNGFLCSKCGHEEASYYPINPRSGGVCIADENGNFYYPPKLNYCPNCGAKMMPLPNPPKGE